MNVSLTPTLERYIQAKVQSGRYSSASEVVREGLRALQEQETAKARLKKAIRDLKEPPQ